MTMHIKVGGAWEEVDPKIKVGGVWEDATEGWVKVSGMWEQFYGSASPYLLNTTGVAGADGLDVGWTGAYGTLDDTFTVDGKLFGTWADIGGTTGTIIVAGFGADPGQAGWAASFTIGATTLTSAAASTYNYSSGTATWEWASTFGFVDTDPFTAQVTA